MLMNINVEESTDVFKIILGTEHFLELISKLFHIINSKTIVSKWDSMSIHYFETIVP